MKLTSTSSTSTVGSFWYDTSSKTIKFTGCAGVWSSGSNLPMAFYANAGFGTQNAAVSVGGLPTFSCTFEYNGSSWSSGCALNLPRFAASVAGTQNEGIIFGGVNPSTGNNTCTEEYNGSSWTSVCNKIFPTTQNMGAGTQNATLSIGTPTLPSLFTEKYNGTSWSQSDSLVLNMVEGYGTVGTQNETLTIGTATGQTVIPLLQEYNGISWSIGINQINQLSLGQSFGTQNDAITQGGDYCGPPQEYSSTCTYGYDGIAWSVCNSSINRRRYGAGAGSASSGLVFAGFAPTNGNLCSTEEFSCGIYVASLS
jgi:hypothetical protein